MDWRAGLQDSQFILGPEVTELESELAKFCGATHCVAVSSGTDALQIALMAENIGRGDAVFLPAFTYTATAEVPFTRFLRLSLFQLTVGMATTLFYGTLNRLNRGFDIDDHSPLHATRRVRTDTGDFNPTIIGGLTDYRDDLGRSNVQPDNHIGCVG